MPFFGERTVRHIRNADDHRARVARLRSQLNDFYALAAARKDDDRRILRKRCELQQFGGILQIDRMPMLMQHRANIQCRMPTTSDSCQIHMPRIANGLRRSIELRSARTDRASSAPTRPREPLDGPLQLLRLPQYVTEKMCC